ncbi:MAG: PDDEXK nuclease domain-containing protein [Candidatus Gastranaerophilales bacterium]|nr:PDDEXK nuclease domain-containing protein [Candidatus Gastranaerophilales bacterium]
MANGVSKIYSDIAELLKTARSKACVTVNSIMVKTYWKIGQRIVEEEQDGALRAEYGTKLIENLSKYLTDTFGKGFSEANLKNMRQFYITYPEFDRHCLANLSWSNIARILRIDNPDERNYYLVEASSQNWSYRQLERNIKSGYYHRLLSTQEGINNTEKCLPAVINTKEFIKDPYVLEFLDLPENIEGKESTLESALITNLQTFLLELGKGFSFVARQFRISTETEHFYADLVFYNYILKCFVVIDLKTTKLSHADIGQMDMYVRMFDNLKRGMDDNPTIGIILCTDKSETMVKYSVLKESQQIFASKYKTVLPTEEELADMITKENIKLLTEEN